MSPSTFCVAEYTSMLLLSQRLAHIAYLVSICESTVVRRTSVTTQDWLVGRLSGDFQLPLFIVRRPLHHEMQSMYVGNVSRTDMEDP